MKKIVISVLVLCVCIGAIVAATKSSDYITISNNSSYANHKIEIEKGISSEKIASIVHYSVVEIDNYVYILSDTITMFEKSNIHNLTTINNDDYNPEKLGVYTDELIALGDDKVLYNYSSSFSDGTTNNYICTANRDLSDQNCVKHDKLFYTLNYSDNTIYCVITGYNGGLFINAYDLNLNLIESTSALNDENVSYYVDENMVISFDHVNTIIVEKRGLKTNKYSNEAYESDYAVNITKVGNDYYLSFFDKLVVVTNGDFENPLIIETYKRISHTTNSGVVYITEDNIATEYSFIENKIINSVNIDNDDDEKYIILFD